MIRKTGQAQGICAYCTRSGPLNATAFHNDQMYYYCSEECKKQAEKEW